MVRRNHNGRSGISGASAWLCKGSRQRNRPIASGRRTYLGGFPERATARLTEFFSRFDELGCCSSCSGSEARPASAADENHGGSVSEEGVSMPSLVCLAFILATPVPVWCTATPHRWSSDGTPPLKVCLTCKCSKIGKILQHRSRSQRMMTSKAASYLSRWRHSDCRPQIAILSNLEAHYGTRPAYPPSLPPATAIDRLED